MTVVLDFSAVTVPTPEPYDDKHEHRQRENVAFVALQLAQQAKQQGVKIVYTDNDDTPQGFQLDGTQKATDALKWNGQVLDFGPLKIVLFNGSAAVQEVL